MEDAAREDQDQDPMVVWVGTRYGEIPEMDAAIAALSDYAEVPDDIR